MFFYVRLCDQQRSFAAKLKGPFGLDGRNNMNAFTASRFYESVISIALNVFSQVKCKLDHFCKRVFFRRVEVPNDVVGLVIVRCSAMHLMKLDACEICQPNKRSF